MSEEEKTEKKGFHESIIVNNDYLDKYAALDDRQFGQLLRAGLKYQRSCGEVPEIHDAFVRFAFDSVKVNIDYNNAKYLKTSQERSKAAKKRWGHEEE